MDHELANEMKKLTKAVNKSNNLWWTFFHGAVNGFGVIVGAALLAALFIAILSRVEGWAYIGTFAHNIMDIIRQKQK